MQPSTANYLGTAAYGRTVRMVEFKIAVKSLKKITGDLYSILLLLNIGRV